MEGDAAPSATRIREHCEALARCSEDGGGLTRAIPSPEHRAAGALVQGWTRDAGMPARQDGIGNCLRRGVQIDMRPTHEGGTGTSAGWLSHQIGAAIAAEGLPVRALPSGAGHDGMAMVDVTDIGMLFVRCAGGISHHPAEAVALDDIGIAARVPALRREFEGRGGVGAAYPARGACARRADRARQTRPPAGRRTQWAHSAVSRGGPTLGTEHGK